MDAHIAILMLKNGYTVTNFGNDIDRAEHYEYRVRENHPDVVTYSIGHPDHGVHVILYCDPPVEFVNEELEAIQSLMRNIAYAQDMVADCMNDIRRHIDRQEKPNI